MNNKNDQDCEESDDTKIKYNKERERADISDLKAMKAKVKFAELQRKLSDLQKTTCPLEISSTVI